MCAFSKILDSDQEFYFAILVKFVKHCVLAAQPPLRSSPNLHYSSSLLVSQYRNISDGGQSFLRGSCSNDLCSLVRVSFIKQGCAPLHFVV